MYWGILWSRQREHVEVHLGMHFACRDVVQVLQRAGCRDARRDGSGAGSAYGCYAVRVWHGGQMAA